MPLDGASLPLPFRSSARANITLSGKKRRKLLQQIRHAQREKAAMEGEEDGGLGRVGARKGLGPFEEEMGGKKLRVFHCLTFPSTPPSVEAPPKPGRTTEAQPRRQKKRKTGVSQDVEMEDLEPDS